jgi:hypothetical protein
MNWEVEVGPTTKLSNCLKSIMKISKLEPYSRYKTKRLVLRPGAAYRRIFIAKIIIQWK